MLNWSRIEHIEWFDDVMKDGIKNLPGRVILNSSASSSALAGRIGGLVSESESNFNSNFLICIRKKLV